MASIGFHGSSLKSGGRVLPALQVLIGGGTLGSGFGRIADKVTKIPSRRAPQALRVILDDHRANGQGQSFNDYCVEKGDRYYYELLKPLADLSSLINEEFIDWGQQEKFETAIGVGECAGVMIDLVATLILEAEEKLSHSRACHDAGAWADAIYHAYSAQVHAAKALLLQKGVQCNTQIGILGDFDRQFTDTGLYTTSSGSFKADVMRMNDIQPSEAFATEYLEQAVTFTERSREMREELLRSEN
jgi:sulfite reductase (ferredoxin)